MEGRIITRNDLQCRILLEQKSKACQAYLARLTRVKRAEYEETRKWAYTECRKKTRQDINQQLIAIEKERSLQRTLPPPHSYGNQRLQRQFDGLLMMGIVMPETC